MMEKYSGVNGKIIEKNTANDNDPYRVIRKAKINVPKLEGNRTICVKAVDVFGFESATKIEIKKE